jgi:hypothetical protein
MRLLLLDLAIFLSPTLCFWLYVQLLKLQNGQRDLPLTPVLLLLMSGLTLVAVSLVALGLPQAHAPGEVYEPAHMEDGKLVPGRTAKHE